MNIVISYESKVPIYEQIKRQIRDSILSGGLNENDPLPSLRQLARDLQVSLVTTTRAYGDLELEGFIKTVPGKGAFVRKIDGDVIRSQYKKECEEALAIARQRALSAGLTMDDLHRMLDAMEEKTE